MNLTSGKNNLQIWHWIIVSFYYWWCYWLTLITWNAFFGKNTNGSPSILLPTQMLRHVFLFHRTEYKINTLLPLKLFTFYIYLRSYVRSFLGISNISAGDTQHISHSHSAAHTHRMFQKSSAAQLYTKKNSTHQWFAHITWQCPFNINTQRSKIFS